MEGSMDAAKKMSLGNIYKFVEKESHKIVKREELKSQNDSEHILKIREAQKLIANFSIPKPKTFTLTSSEINAYM
jgi:hypothetical protein